MMSLSGLDYSAIGFSKTRTEEFEDLKAGQANLTERIGAVTQWHDALALRRLLAEQEEAHKAAKAASAAAAAATAASAAGVAIAEAPAKAEAEPTDIAIGRAVSEGQFCETRADLIDDIQEWAKEAGQKIAMFPSKRSTDRTRRTIDFINRTKVLLRKCPPIGEEEKEEDAEWLSTWTKELESTATTWMVSL